MIKFFKKILNNPKHEEITTKSTDPRHAKDFRGVTRPTATISTKSGNVMNLGSRIPITKKDIYEQGDVQHIASNIQLLRERKGMSQLFLAQALGYKSASFISRIELWETERLTHEQLIKIAACLDVQVEELLFKS